MSERLGLALRQLQVILNRARAVLRERLARRLIVSALYRPMPLPAVTGDFVAQPGELACQELVELVADYLDGVLPAGPKDKFLEHLNGCGGCVEYVRQISLTIRALQQADLQLTPRPQAVTSLEKNELSG